MKLLQVLLRIRHERPFAWLKLPTQRHRRTAVAGLWTAFAAHVAISALAGDGELAGFLGFVTLFAGILCLFSLAEASVLRGGALPLDASRLAARDRAYAAAFHGTGWLLLAVVVYAELALRIDALWLPADPRSAVGAFAAVAVAIGLLPVSLLSWTEPDDAPAPPPPASHLPRRPRRFAVGPEDREGPRFLH
ncbi:hypothetical protein [Longimicrobium sp.]|uniref:hypothetical protein n=1 Tax=Longimicrobium sp. TaxID=2029185 RepID=UPI003B3B83A5